MPTGTQVEKAMRGNMSFIKKFLGGEEGQVLPGAWNRGDLADLCVGDGG
jgi:hypothetical protein